MARHHVPGYALACLASCEPSAPSGTNSATGSTNGEGTSDASSEPSGAPTSTSQSSPTGGDSSSTDSSPTTSSSSTSSSSTSSTADDTSSTGAPEVCGDGLVTATEECDDGNNESFDGCSAGCGIEQRLRQVCVGDHTTCVLTDNHAVKCWGGNAFGSLGLGDIEHRGDNPGEMGAALPAVDLGMDVAQLSCGRVTCALGTAGDVKCWGLAGAGLGLGFDETNHIGDEPGEMGDALPFVDLDEPATALEVTFAGGCVVLQSGALKCWGYNNLGQLGLGDTEHRGDQPGEMGAALPPVELGDLQVASVSGGGSWACANDTLGRLKCWGDNILCKLGLEGTDPRGDEPGEMGEALPFVDLGQDTVVTQIVAGKDNTCALLGDGRLKCWGANMAHQLLASPDDKAAVGCKAEDMGEGLPGFDLGGKHVTSVAAGFNVICALLDDRSVKCWGYNAKWGLMGLGNTDYYLGPPHAELPPIDFGVGETVEQLALTHTHACVLLDSGRLKCWGDNSTGQLGYGDTNDRGDEPGEMGDALPYVEIF